MYYYSRDALIIMLQEFAAENGRCPTSKDIGGNSGIPGEKAFKAVFGGFHDALVAAGLRPRKREDSSNAYLVQMLRILAKRVGRVPTTSDLQKYRDMPTWGTYNERFGSWKEALRYAGLDGEPSGDEGASAT